MHPTLVYTQQILTTALGFGSGAIWWFGYHKPTVAAKDAWYAAREQEKSNQ